MLAETSFGKIFVVASETASKVGAELIVPRLTGRQQNRDNYDGHGNVEQYIR